MHRTGHIGAALLAYTPLGFVTVALGFDGLALLGGAAAFGLDLLPDWDQRVPLLPHRGLTHTATFALLVSAGLGILGLLIGAERGLLAG